MHDIRLIREDPAAFDAAMARRGMAGQAEALIALDTKRRAALTAQQDGQARRNALSREFGECKRKGAEPPAELVAELEALKHDLPQGEAEAVQLDVDIYAALAALPNRPADDVPDGDDESANLEVGRWGTPRAFAFTPREHADLGPPLGLDFETGALISGARFTFLRGQMARLQRALGQFMLDRQVTAGFTECAPPLLVKDDAVFGTGQLPKFSGDLFQMFRRLTPEDVAERAYKRFGDMLADLEMDDIPAGVTAIFRDREEFIEELEREWDRLWLIPTAEVSLTNAVREKILKETDLPLRMTALTPCFRSEAGAAGKDTRGFIRQHQFDKVELVAICRPEDSEAEHEAMTQAAEAILQALELPYRKMLLCAGDMGFTARKTYDLEVWLPGQDTYREISSVSNCGDFQARRMNARFKRDGQKGTEFVHTLNGSGLAVGRTLVAVLENYQEEDGSVIVPSALQSYMGGVTRLTLA